MLQRRVGISCSDASERRYGDPSGFAGAGNRTGYKLGSGSGTKTGWRDVRKHKKPIQYGKRSRTKIKIRSA